MRYNDVGEPIGRFAVRNGAFIHPIAAECYGCFPESGCRFCPVAARERQIAEYGYALDDEDDEEY